MLKGFAIMLVVYVHLYYAGIGELPFGMRYIRSFHMPLFSFASGFLTFGRTNLPFGKYFFKKARALFVPYTVFFFIFIAVSQIFSLLQNQCFIKLNIDWLWAYLVAGKKLELIDGQTGGFSIIVLWFFTTTFFAYVAFWFLTRLNKYMFIIATVLLALLSLWFQKIFLNIEFTTPYNVKIIPIFTFYMCIGAIFKQYFIGKVSKPTKAVLSVVMVAVAAAVVIAKGGVGSIRTFEPLYIPLSILSVFGYYGLFSLLGRSKVFEYWGRHSLYIYGLHVIFLNIIHKALLYKGIYHLRGNYIAHLLIVFFSIGLCCLCFEAYERIKFKLVGR